VYLIHRQYDDDDVYDDVDDVLQFDLLQYQHQKKLEHNQQLDTDFHIQNCYHQIVVAEDNQRHHMEHHNHYRAVQHHL